MIDQDHKYYSVGFNHDTCPLDLREALAIGDDEIESALKSLQKSAGVSESVILSTCNRTEIYSLATSSDEVLKWFADYRGFSVEKLSPVLYAHAGVFVAQHAFRVSAGLDSMVLGETQILGQLKNSVRAADASGALGPKLRHLFDTSFSVAKYIRTNTNVGAHSISLAAASAKVSERIFGALENSKVLFIGVGDMNRTCAEYFASLNVHGMYFANRTLSRAEALADALKGNAFPLNEVVERLCEFDIVVSCTSSLIPVLEKEMIQKAIDARRHKPMLLIDLAVPRDIEPKASELEDVFLYTVDDLGEIVKNGMKNRKAAAWEAEKIIEDRLIQFSAELDKAKSTPIVKKFRQRGELIRDRELEKALALLAEGKEPEIVIKSLSRAITNKFMDEPSRALNNDSKGEKLSLPEALERLYGLNKN